MEAKPSDSESSGLDPHTDLNTALETHAPRSWWQIHLATLLLLVSMVAFFVWINTRGVQIMAIYRSETGELLRIAPSSEGSQLGYGWPQLAYSDGRGGRFDWHNLGFDMAIAAVFFFVTAISAEFSIRRRFKFRLSTAVVMMFVAALMTGVIVRYDWLDRAAWERAPGAAAAVCLSYITLLAASLLISEWIHRRRADRI